MNKPRISLVFMIILVWVAITGLGPLPQQTINSAVPNQVTAPAAPDPFEKFAPGNGKTDVPTNSVILRWNASSAGVTYQYCLRPNINPHQPCPAKKWIRVGTNTSVVLQGLTAGKTYYWQVRAVDSAGQPTYADGGTWWSFTTVASTAMPGYFEKTAPADLSPDQPVNGLALTWSASSGATSYQYCYDTTNNNLCDDAWTTSSGLTASLSGLSYGTTYYWQVRALNAAGNVQADYGDWYSFQTQPAPGGAFGKTDPKNKATEQPIDLTITWALSEGTGISYEYCVSTSACTDSSTWTSAGTELSADLSNLQYGTTYHWQVRGVNQTATVYANDGVEWTFSTIAPPPAAFDKTSPGNNATGQPVVLDLTWSASTGATSYEYCISTATCTSNSIWLPAGANTSVSVSGLAYNTPYYWQVRAINTTGATYANDGSVWEFTTQIAPPSGFVKLSPTTASTQVPPTLTLQWSPSTGASEYFYCVDTSSHTDGDSTCASPGWVSNGTLTESAHLSLAYATTYHWQVRAVNSQGSMLANDGVWWSFTTVDAAPQDFTKMSPTNGAVDQSLTPWLYWWTPTNAGATYEYCISSSASCTGGSKWQAITENTPIHITTALPNGVTRYWQVRANTGGGTTEANGGTWWTFTTLKAPPTSSNQPFSTNENTAFTGQLTAASNYPDKVFSLTGSQPAGNLVFHSDGSFTYTPVQHFSGTVTFQFMISDGHNSPVGPFTATITVNEVNYPPVLSAIPDQTGERSKELTFYAQATDPDISYGQDYLTYDIVEELPAGASMDPVSGLFRWPIPANQVGGKYTYTVRVTDSQGSTATQTVNITISSYKLMLPIIHN